MSEPFKGAWQSGDRQAMVRAVLEDLGTAGAFADWLEDHGEEEAGVLLRRRWKRWLKEMGGSRSGLPSTTFHNYVCKWFTIQGEVI
jgi:hypothetical protein